MRSTLLPLLLAGFALTAPSLPSAQKQALVAEDLVEIFYDDHMVPHVFGESDEAAFVGLGYHHMRDFPIGTLNMLWLHSGRMAEVAGESYLDEDRLVRLWEVPAIADRHRNELAQKKLLRLIKAYVRGIEAGRRWWRDNGNPAESTRLDKLVGEDFRVRVDPAPDYLNQTFSPYGDFDDPNVLPQMRRVLDRLFAPSQEITVDHVLRLGVCINSFFLLRNNPVPLNALPAAVPEGPLPIVPSPLEDFRIETSTQNVKASNGWMISPGGVLGGGVMTATDSHVVLNKLHIRPYLLQIHGGRFQASGLGMPGYPGIYMGFNDWISWLFTAPADEPVARNEWMVTLEDVGTSPDLTFQYEFEDGVFDFVRLVEENETLLYFDPAAGDVKEYEDTRFYVPRHASEASLGFERYPVIPDTGSAPEPGSDVYFQQAAFTTEGSPWETMLRFGYARNATTHVEAIFDNALIIFGNGNNMMVADRQGNFRYKFMARIPEQGLGVPASMYSETAVLDGSNHGWRWRGYHPGSEYPSIGPANVAFTKEVWINNNVTPDMVEESRFHEADLAAFPEYMVSNSTIATWRQVRAIEMLRDQPLVADLAFNDLPGSDVRNQWMHMMWPFFSDANELHPDGINQDASLFASWVDEYKSHDENDNFNASYNFEAHPFSQVTVYAALLRSHYLSELGRSIEGDNLSEESETFGHDPLHALYADPGAFNYNDYPANLDAMKFALETVAELWKEGDSALGLANQSLMGQMSPNLDGDPWGDPRFSTPIEPHWAPFIAGSNMTRWGHINMGTLTPHYLPPPKNDFVEGVDGRGGDRHEFIRGHFYSAFAPPLLATTQYDLLKTPFYMEQPARARPLGGIDSALFVPRHLPIFNEPAPLGYEESFYGWGAADQIGWHPQTQGSQTLLTVFLRPGRRAQARFLEAIGGTEITKVDLLGNGELDYQKRFAPSVEFANSEWRFLETNKGALGSPTHVFRYAPYDTVSRDL